MNTRIFCLLFIIFVAYISCDNDQIKSLDKNDFYSYDWIRYIDSNKLYVIKSKAVDSIILYYIRDDAPSVLGKIHVLCWKNGKKIMNDECLQNIDGCLMASNEHFVFYIKRKKSIYMCELRTHDSLACVNKKIIDISSSACIEIYDVKKDTILENVIYFKVEMIDVCFEKMSDSSLIYRFDQ